MNYFDVIIFIILGLFTIRGVFRGLVTELIILISLIMGFVIAFTYLDDARQFILGMFPLLPDSVARIVAFIILFLVINIVLRILGRVLNKFVTFTFLQPINRLAGGVFAFFKVAIIMSLVFVLIDFIPLSKEIEKMIGADQSFSYAPLQKLAPAVYSFFLSVFPNHENLQEKFMRTIQSADSTARKHVLPF